MGGFGVGVGVSTCVGVAVGNGACVGVGVTALVCPAAVDPQEASTMMSRTRPKTTTLFLLCTTL